MTGNLDPALVSNVSEGFASGVSWARFLGASLAVLGLIGSLAFFLRISVARGWFTALGGFDLPHCPEGENQESILLPKDKPSTSAKNNPPTGDSEERRAPEEEGTGLFYRLRVLLPRLKNGACSNLAGKRKRRLRVVETLPLDMRRRLVIVACDDQEHLLLLGSQQDMLVSSPLPHRRFSGVDSAQR